ncbi:hypothetical protein Lfu02_62290 [Longispora fulva]|uniref:Zn-dependent metalloprotease n=1 Tax=Longispora fulva TaxID=619741 RepID=A0A8J7GAA3_9ACTN|nr:M4 family metallopeptidase [Longispora fulva]MBG6134649.1 Zn-dependent metalloprotease [Longispora fulva]GIG61857.1 hypothetical protein Lfu02_62290 [Longispora fulva]
MKNTRVLAAGVAVGAAVAVAIASAVTASGAPSAQPSALVADVAAPDPSAAVAGAERVIAADPAAVHGAPGESYTSRGVVSTPQGLQYVTYDRRYQGLAVVGGDFTVVTDAHGNVRSTTAAQTRAITVATTPAVAAGQATATSRAQLPHVDAVTGQRLVVLAWGEPKLAWETIVVGLTEHAPSRLHVFVDAATGAVLRADDEVKAGEGTGKWNGPNPLAIDTTHSGSTYTTADPNRPGVKCTDIGTKQVFSGSDDTWGNGSGGDRETGCVDVLYDVQHEWDMLKNWLGRSGIDGRGNGFEVRVGLGDVNAYWTGDHIEIGHNNNNDWISSMDVVGHENGHAIDQFTGGGTAGEAGLGEATGDIFGALTEAYANQSAQYDAPDYLVGEMINLTGNGPIRNMADPSKVGNHPNCYSSSIPNTEVHAAAGPMNHWFYLLAEGTNPGNGKPTSPTCNNGGTLTGIGIRQAGQVFYNAMLAKPSNVSYKQYRTLTLKAAKDIDSTCGYFAKAKAAWDAVSVPAQSGDPTCSGSTPTASPSTSPTASPTASPSTSPTAGPTSSPTGQPGGTVTVTNPGQQTGFVGFQAFPLQIRATSSTGGTLTYSATGLPPGLSISSSGAVSGRPTTAGTYTVKVTATNSGGATGSTTFSYQIYGF